MSADNVENAAIEMIRANGGQMRMSEALACGMSRYLLYRLRDLGIIEPLSRGLFRLTDLPPFTNPDLVTISLRYSKAVICLLSALAFHDLTTQVPHNVSVALPQGSRIPSRSYPPMTVYRFGEEAYRAGIEEHRIDGAMVKLYSPEKTLADCFKFRNKVGWDIVLEAVKLYRSRFPFRVDDLLEYARINRVDQIMRPYLEMVL